MYAGVVSIKSHQYRDVAPRQHHRPRHIKAWPGRRSLWCFNSIPNNSVELVSKIRILRDNLPATLYGSRSKRQRQRLDSRQDAPGFGSGADPLPMLK